MAKYPGLLITPEQRQQAGWQGLLNLGTGLMAGGGPSTTPTSFAQALGQGGQGFMQGYQGQMDRARQQQMQGMQAKSAQTQQELAEGKLKFAQENPSLAYGGAASMGTAPMRNMAERGRLVEMHGEGSPQVRQFDNYVRATPWLNTGGEFVQPSIQTPSVPSASIPKTLPPEKRPENIAAGAEAQAGGTERGATRASLEAAEASFPTLDAAVTNLKKLGETATYTTSGQIADTVRRELGLTPSEGATSRAAYIAHVKNNVLPLLRQTFGAAFTQAEGDSLLATFGDINMSPGEKNAVLDALIADKKADLQRLRRQAGQESELGPATPLGGPQLDAAGDGDIDAILKGYGL